MGKPAAEFSEPLALDQRRLHAVRRRTNLRQFFHCLRMLPASRLCQRELIGNAFIVGHVGNLPGADIGRHFLRMGSRIHGAKKRPPGMPKQGDAFAPKLCTQMIDHDVYVGDKLR